MYATIHQLPRNPVFTTMLNEYTVEGFIHLVKTIQQTIQWLTNYLVKWSNKYLVL